MVKELLPLLFPAAQDFFDVLFNLYARQHNLMAAFLAADLKIHAHAQYVKPVGTTGVRLFGYDHITNLKSILPPPFFDLVRRATGCACEQCDTDIIIYHPGSFENSPAGKSCPRQENLL